MKNKKLKEKFLQKYNYRVVGFKKKVGDKLLDIVSINVVAETSSQALDKAKKIIKKNYYRVAEVNEIVENKQLEEYNFQAFLHNKESNNFQQESLKLSQQYLEQMTKITKLLENLIKTLER
jgi:hypothetical protein